MNRTNWQPSASIDTLKKRAQIIKDIRTFFDDRGYLEVETPCMGRFGVTDVYLSNIKAFFQNKPYYLQTSPEYHMKRLLAAGSGPIFQLARVFRDDELGRWHNPEFTLLEWYQLSVDHHQLMDEVDAFLQVIIGCGAMQRMTYQQAFIDSCGFDPMSADLSTLKSVLQRFHLQDVLSEQETDPDQYLFLLMSHVVEPALAKEINPVALYHFPVTQAALAKTNQGVAERFEVYYRGVELANGFHELTDPVLQVERFKKDKEKRAALGLPPSEIDDLFLEALQHGLPPCSGVALGVDRLLALALNKNAIKEILAFDFNYS